SGVFVLNLAENTLLDFLRITKKQYPEEWDKFLAYLDMQGLFDKIQGVQLSQLFDTIGPLAAVEYAIYKHSKWIAVREVTAAGIAKASLDQRSALLKVLLSFPPLGNKGEQQALNLLETTVRDSGQAAMKQIVAHAGGMELLYLQIQGKERDKLRELYPVYKTCLICGGDGKLFEPEICTNCNGTGVARTRTCQTCHGSGEIDCWRCGGDGTIHDLIMPTECWNCHGTGHGWLFRTCRVCGGDGQIFDNLPGEEQCPKCLGTGMLQCWRCGGSGEIETPCRICGGDGRTHDIIDEQECPRCKGAGEVLI
ncbi:MAG TPA: hypothetical protein VKA68_07810, partial [bacterium]|nr:hypothetical protein [bacterium]